MQLSLMSDSRLNLVNPRFWCISYSAIVRYNLILESWDNYGARPGLALLYKFLLTKLASFFFVYRLNICDLQYKEVPDTGAPCRALLLLSVIKGGRSCLLG